MVYGLLVESTGSGQEESQMTWVEFLREVATKPDENAGCGPGVGKNN